MPELLTDAQLDEMIQLVKSWPYVRGQFRRAAQVWLPRLVRDMRTLMAALRVLHAANAEGPCPTCPSAEAWESEELRVIREAIEEANG